MRQRSSLTVALKAHELLAFAGVFTIAACRRGSGCQPPEYLDGVSRYVGKTAGIRVANRRPSPREFEAAALAGLGQPAVQRSRGRLAVNRRFHPVVGN